MVLQWRLLIIPIVLLLIGCSAPRGIYHRVEKGQTLYRISSEYGLNQRYLARINHIHDPSQLKVGQRLFIPGATRVRSVPATVPAKKVASSTSRRTKAKTSSKWKPKSKATAKTATAGAKGAPKPAKGQFSYPVKGKIVKHFGDNSGQINRGIEFAIPLNGAIKSAAAGRVIYSGNGVKGYGNLIILKHDQSFYTVYGFNAKNLVAVGNYVSKGQKIALGGVPPGGGGPRLHFEIRYGKNAVNPIFYLP
jgi:murein DD-endopeptidase MepM/ murein hydrolase activator NlpD